ncbi:MAG TPA: hypothetical protein ENJ40_05035 [Thermosulfurimonas dismutans]|uniref:STT3/PglB/AglB core domain-containing protein n=1 Tax=Thermosulfurimonas dismutans TaxID=999894 RepID=A0A7C3H4I9_9BACT|nr:hypothetical protein [Thermosulfurimonas dismutans]
MWPTNSARAREWTLRGIKILCLVLIALAGLQVRLDDQAIWKKRQNVWYLDRNRPIFASYDAFYFARMARDWQEGRYRSGKPDFYRAVPDSYLTDNITYPFPVPLMSFSAEKLSRVFGIPLERLDLYFTPILAVLFVLPLFLYLESLGYTAAGLLGGLVGVTALIYVIRTSIMRFDTDSLNLFFPFMVAWCLSMYFRSSRPRLWVSLASFFSFLYYWWYAHPHLILVNILLFAGLLRWERGCLEREDWLALAILVVPNLWYLWKSPVALGKQIYEYVVAVVRPEATGIFRDYPNIQQSISELQHFKNLSEVARLTLQNVPLFLLGLAGTVVLLVRERRALLFLWPYFLIGLLVFRAGNRFAMYLAPFVGVGVGFWMDLAFRQGRKRLRESTLHLLRLLGIVAVGIWILASQKSTFAYVATPKANAFVVRDMVKLSRILPPRAWIWSWWDYGYAFQYLSRRGTFVDGGHQLTPKTYYVARSFTTSSPREARNITAFIATEGLLGIKKRLKKGTTAAALTEAISRGELYRPPDHPVYWVFTQDLSPKYGWIGYFGSWDFRKHRGRYGFVWPLNPCREMPQKILVCQRGVRIDPITRRVFLGHREFPLRGIVYREARGVNQRLWGPEGMILEIVSSSYGRVFFLVDDPTFRSLFNQMYILRQYDPRYFRLVMDDFPFMVVYEVKF